MIQSNQKQSLLVPYELPKFISEDPTYANFTTFLKAYYEWMEEQGNVLDFTKSIPSYMDIDTTSQEFLNYYVNDFMSYFPQDILSDPRKVIKIAKQLYQSKGTPASYEFLFRVLYNTDVDFFYTKDAVFKASGGKWYVPRSLKLATADPNFLHVNNYRIFGNTSKSIATIETSVFDGLKTEVFISNIERLFQSGETVTIVDNRNQPLYFLNGEVVPAGTVGAETLTALIVGQISQVLISPKNRGLNYSVGDPVVFYGGLNPNTPNPTGAIAEVGSVTVGSIQGITVITEGYGYTQSGAALTVGSANTQVSFTDLVGQSPKAPLAVVGGLDPIGQANATFIPLDSLVLKENITLGNANYHFASGNYLTVPQPAQFANNETVYQGPSLAANTFSGKVTNMDPANNVLLLVTNLTGTISNTAPLIGNSTHASRHILAHESLGANVRIQYDVGQFQVGEGVYQGPNLANSTFSAQIVSNYSVGSSNNVLQLTNVVGTISLGNNITGYVTGVNTNTLAFTTANANTVMANAFNFGAFTTYPISSIIIENQGGGFTQNPTVEVTSLYTEDDYSQSNLANLGILAPVQIFNAGSGYSVGDNIKFIGGTGYGAYAQVTQTGTNGSIVSVSYVNQKIGNTPNPYPLGGMGYFNGLPQVTPTRLATGTISANSSNMYVTGTGTNFTANLSNNGLLVTSSNVVIGTIQSIINANTLMLTTNASSTVSSSNFYLGTAILGVTGYLGSGATFSEIANRIGSIVSFNILDNGADYVAAPNISLVVQDLIVQNVSPVYLPVAGDTIYQGNTRNSTYSATVDSIFVLENAIPTSNSIYQLRVYNYNSKPNFDLPLKIDSIGANYNLVSGYTNIHNTTFDNSTGDTRFDSANGIMTYGDGHAKATATFLNGLVIGNGQYLDSSGQPSAFDVLQSLEYNNFTYEITLEKEIAKYRDVLLNLLHPSGMKVIGRFAMKSNNSFNFTTTDALQTGYPLYHYVNTGSGAYIVGGTAAKPSNNIVVISNTLGANLANIFTPNNSTISFTYGTGVTDFVSSLVIGVNSAANTITLQDNVWTYFANVAVANTINNIQLNIMSLTGSYDFINNGNYSNTDYPMKDVIRVNDVLYVNGTSQTVSSVNYETNVVTLSGALSSGGNGLVSISRTMSSTYENVQVYGPVGTQYFLSLTDELGNILTDEQGNELLIG